MVAGVYGCTNTNKQRLNHQIHGKQIRNRIIEFVSFRDVFLYDVCVLQNFLAACETQVMLPTMNPTVRFVWFVGVVNVLSNSMCAIMYIVENPNGMNSFCARNPFSKRRYCHLQFCWVWEKGKSTKRKRHSSSTTLEKAVVQRQCWR
jgi:hypothetical protein